MQRQSGSAEDVQRQSVQRTCRGRAYRGREEAACRASMQRGRCYRGPADREHRGRAEADVTDNAQCRGAVICYRSMTSSRRNDSIREGRRGQPPRSRVVTDTRHTVCRVPELPARHIMLLHYVTRRVTSAGDVITSLGLAARDELERSHIIFLTALPAISFSRSSLFCCRILARSMRSMNAFFRNRS